MPPYSAQGGFKGDVFIVDSTRLMRASEQLSGDAGLADAARQEFEWSRSLLPLVQVGDSLQPDVVLFANAWEDALQTISAEIRALSTRVTTGALTAVLVDLSIAERLQMR